MNNKTQKISTILRWGSFISILASYLLAYGIDGKFFGAVSFIRYSWVMYIFTIIPIALIIVDVFFNKDKKSSNILVAILCIFILCALGSFRFIFSSKITYDKQEAIEICEEADISLPQAIDVVCEEEFEYKKIQVKIKEEQDRKSLEDRISKHPKVLKELSPDIYLDIHWGIRDELLSEDYYIYIKKSTGNILFVYSLEKQKLLVIQFENS